MVKIKLFPQLRRRKVQRKRSNKLLQFQMSNVSFRIFTLNNYKYNIFF